MTVDELARAGDIPVRTIRDYQTLGLLRPPQRRGRVGVYDPEHLHRLQLIGRLQARGYSLAGIRDLLDAWESGKNLPAILGVEVGPGALDETPTEFTATQLRGRIPGLTGGRLRQAQAVGLIHPRSRGRFVVRSPALIALVADAVGAGLPLTETLNLVGEIRDRLGGLADVVADRFVEGIWTPGLASGRGADMEPLLRRDRLLLIQAAASLLAHELGRALLAADTGDATGMGLRRAIQTTQVGALVDTKGTTTHAPGD
jgi:DNA-binding transcriptional MerR regulator